ncbi:MAG: hypothetical protein LUF04_15090 [Bacteroides sp.]|nr:hypothetical protein [Bacteroides sp.]
MNTDTLSLLKSNLPPGYEKRIAREIGCSVGTVHNIMNGKHCSRSGYKEKVIEVALRLAEENRQAWLQKEKAMRSFEG